MKKIILTLSVNLLLFVCIVFVADFIFAYKMYSAKIDFMERNIINIHKLKNTPEIQRPKFEYKLSKEHFSKFWNRKRKKFHTLRREIIAKHSDKKSIIQFGCSMVEGNFLKDDETFAYQLAKLSNRTVYNRGFSGLGPANMLWQTQQNKFYEDIITEPEYAIYVYMFDHLRRINVDKYGFTFGVYVGYEVENGKLVEKKPKDFLINYLSFVKQNTIKSMEQRLENNMDYYFDIIKLHFIQSKNELQKRYPNIKFIILKYPIHISNRNAVSEATRKSYTTSRWKELEKEGFIVYDLTEHLEISIDNDEYRLPDGHPNAKAWEIVTKKIVEDFKM